MVKRMIRRWRARWAAARRRRQGDVEMVKMTPGSRNVRGRWRITWEHVGKSLDRPGPRLLTRTFLFLFLIGAAYGLWRGSQTEFVRPEVQLPPPVMFEPGPMADGPLLAGSPPAETNESAPSSSSVRDTTVHTVTPDNETAGLSSSAAASPDLTQAEVMPVNDDTELAQSAPGVPAQATPVDLSEMVWPVTGGVTANYGWQRDPITSEWHFRPGLVIAPERDPAPVRASLSGVVAAVRATADGYRVIMSHAGGWTTEYTGLASAHISEGTYVDVGEAIGEMRAAPARGGLYFVVRNGEGAVNPTSVLYELPVW